MTWSASSGESMIEDTYGELVLLRQLVHTENGNDILERLVVLEDLLDSSGNIVVLLADDTGVKHTRLGVEGVDGGVDTELGNGTGQHGGGVQVGEGGGGGGIGQIVGRDIDSLHGGDGTLLGSGDTLLPVTRVSQGRQKGMNATYMPPMSVERVGW